MSEASPRKNDDTMSGDTSPVKEKEADSRPVASGALRRVFKQREKRSRSRRRRVNNEDEQAGSSDGEDSEEEGPKALSRTTSNHYTLNMPAHPAPPSDTPYVLLG